MNKSVGKVYQTEGLSCGVEITIWETGEHKMNLMV